MIYNNIERVLVITKIIFNYYNTGFSLEITLKVQKVSQKYRFIHKLTTKHNFHTPSLFLISTKTDRYNLRQADQKHAALKTWSWAPVKVTTKTVRLLIMIMRVNCRKRKKTIKGEFISASCIHSDKDIFILIFFLRKNVRYSYEHGRNHHILWGGGAICPPQ